MMNVFLAISLSMSLLACQSSQDNIPKIMDDNEPFTSKQSDQSKKDNDQMNEGNLDRAVGAGLTKSCGGIHFSISHEGGEPAVLTTGDASGKRSVIQPPSEMNEYQPVGLGCSISDVDKKPYFIVQYGEMEGGCSFCEWFYIYDSQGKQLNISKQIIKQDPSLPEGQQQYPDNDEYEAMLGRLHLQHPELDFVK